MEGEEGSGNGKPSASFKRGTGACSLRSEGPIQKYPVLAD